MYYNSNYYETANMLRDVSGYVFVSTSKILLTKIEQSCSKNVRAVCPARRMEGEQGKQPFIMQFVGRRFLQFIFQLTGVIIFLLNTFTKNDILSIFIRNRSINVLIYYQDINYFYQETVIIATRLL